MPETQSVGRRQLQCPLGRLPRLEYGRSGAVVALEEPGLHSLPCAKMPRFNSMAIVTPRRWRAMKSCAPGRKQGRKGWKQQSGDRRRSLAETQIFRHKQIIGDKLREG